MFALIIEFVKQVWLFVNNNIALIMLLLTLASVLIAWRVLRENKRSYDAQYTPKVSLEYRNNDNAFIIENISQGLAIDIKIDDYDLFVEDRDMDMKLIFTKVGNLKPRDKVQVSYSAKNNGNSIDPFLLVTQLSKYSDRNLTFLLTFKDVHGNYYCESINMGEDGVYVKKHFKTNVFTRGYLFIKGKLNTYKKSIYVKITRKYWEKKRPPSPFGRG